MKKLIIPSEVFLGVVWLYSSIAHFQNPYYFLESILYYQIIPSNSISWVFAGVLIFLSLTIGASLVSRLFRQGSLALSLVLLACFLTAQITAYAQGLQIGCGCFGTSSEIVGWKSISMVLGLVALNIYLVQSEFQLIRSIRNICNSFSFGFKNFGLNK